MEPKHLDHVGLRGIGAVKLILERLSRLEEFNSAKPLLLAGLWGGFRQNWRQQPLTPFRTEIAKTERTRMAAHAF